MSELKTSTWELNYLKLKEQIYAIISPCSFKTHIYPNRIYD